MGRVKKYHIPLPEAEARAVEDQLIHDQRAVNKYKTALDAAKTSAIKIEKRRKNEMNIGEAVKKGFKIFKVSTGLGVTYLELVDEFKTYNVKSLTTGNVINVRENYEISPIKNKPSEKILDSENPYRTIKVKNKISRPVPIARAEIPEVIGKRKSNKTEGPTFKDIISENIKKIKCKEDVGVVLKENGIELSSSSIRYGWFLRNQISKGGGDYYGSKERAARAKRKRE